MNDTEFIESLEKVSSAREALAIIVVNERFFGYDPYYNDLRSAMMRMAERVLRSY